MWKSPISSSTPGDTSGSDVSVAEDDNVHNVENMFSVLWHIMRAREVQEQDFCKVAWTCRFASHVLCLCTECTLGARRCTALGRKRGNYHVVVAVSVVEDEEVAVFVSCR